MKFSSSSYVRLRIIVCCILQTLKANFIWIKTKANQPKHSNIPLHYTTTEIKVQFGWDDVDIAIVI